jgi:hypothetical protein
MTSIKIRETARRKFCDRFVREHHPGMADEARIKGARPPVPLGPARQERFKRRQALKSPIRRSQIC